MGWLSRRHPDFLLYPRLMTTVPLAALLRERDESLSVRAPARPGWMVRADDVDRVAAGMLVLGFVAFFLAPIWV